MNYILKDGVLYHHGIKGQKWGFRRYQNEDGSLTPEGREHYGYGEARTKLYNAKQTYKRAKRDSNRAFNKAYNRRNNSMKNLEDFYDKSKKEQSAKRAFKKAKQEYKNSEEYKQAKDKAKRIAIAGAAITATALAAYGAYKVIDGRNKEALERLHEGERLANQIYDFNTPYATISRQSKLTGDIYYKFKNRHGDVIQTGKAGKTLKELQDIRGEEQRIASIVRSDTLNRHRRDYLDAVGKSKRSSTPKFSEDQFSKYNEQLYRLERQLRNDPNNEKIRKMYNDISKRILG